MFGLSQREQRWKADQKAAELLVHLTINLAKQQNELAAKLVKIKKETELEDLKAENERLKAKLKNLSLDKEQEW